MRSALRAARSRARRRPPPAPARQKAPRPEPGPKAQGKTVFASVRRPVADVIADAFAEADRRDPGRERPWIAVIDGNCHQIETVTRLAAGHGVKAEILTGLIHVVQYLWKAANSFFYPGDPEARAWVREQAAKILAGRHRDVRAGSRRRTTAFGYSPTERAGADECARYLENKQGYLDYPAFLNAGWPVASGLIEGTARWLIKDRFEVTGARWSLDGAEAVLKLRALEGNYDYHLRQQKQRDHDSRYQQPQPAAALLALVSLRAAPYRRENGRGTARDVVCFLVRLRPRVSLTPGAGFSRGRSLLLRARGSVSSARPRFPGRYHLAG